MDPFAAGGTVFCLIGAVIIIGFIFLANAIRIVPEYQRLVVFRLGRVDEEGLAARQSVGEETH